MFNLLHFLKDNNLLFVLVLILTLIDKFYNHLILYFSIPTVIIKFYLILYVYADDHEQKCHSIKSRPVCSKCGKECRSSLEHYCSVCSGDLSCVEISANKNNNNNRNVDSVVPLLAINREEIRQSAVLSSPLPLSPKRSESIDGESSVYVLTSTTKLNNIQSLSSSSSSQCQTVNNQQHLPQTLTKKSNRIGQTQRQQRQHFDRREHELVRHAIRHKQSSQVCGDSRHCSKEHRQLNITDDYDNSDRRCGREVLTVSDLCRDSFAVVTAGLAARRGYHQVTQPAVKIISLPTSNQSDHGKINHQLSTPTLRRCVLRKSPINSKNRIVRRISTKKLTSTSLCLLSPKNRLSVVTSTATLPTRTVTRRVESANFLSVPLPLSITNARGLSAAFSKQQPRVDYYRFCKSNRAKTNGEEQCCNNIRGNRRQQQPQPRQECKLKKGISQRRKHSKTREKDTTQTKTGVLRQPWLVTLLSSTVATRHQPSPNRSNIKKIIRLQRPYHYPTILSQISLPRPPPPHRSVTLFPACSSSVAGGHWKTFVPRQHRATDDNNIVAQSSTITSTRPAAAFVTNNSIDYVGANISHKTNNNNYHLHDHKKTVAPTNSINHSHLTSCCSSSPSQSSTFVLSTPSSQTHQSRMNFVSCNNRTMQIQCYNMSTTKGKSHYPRSLLLIVFFYLLVKTFGFNQSELNVFSLSLVCQCLDCKSIKSRFVRRRTHIGRELFDNLRCTLSTCILFSIFMSLGFSFLPSSSIFS